MFRITTRPYSHECHLRCVSAHSGRMTRLTETQIRRRLRRLGCITKRDPSSFSDSGGFQIMEASTGSILEGEDFNLTVDDLASYLRMVEESMAPEKR